MTWAELHFIDALLDRAGEVFVFLPYPPSDIIGQRADDPTWQSHFNQVLERLSPHRITVLPPRSATSNATGPVASCNAAIENEVRKQASLLGELPELIALVRQGEPADLEGDAHAVANWVARGVGDVVRIEIA